MYPFMEAALHRIFFKTHTVFGIQRADEVYTISTLIGYKFYKETELQLQFTHIKDDSNISVFAYDRNIYSAGIQTKF